MSASGSTRVVVAALSGNLLIAVSKFVAAFVTGSVATLAEAVHSVADTGNQVLLLIGMRLSQRDPTEQHPFGRAAEQYFWPFVVSIMLFTIGAAFALYEGVHKLLEADAPHHSNLWSYVVLGVSFALESYSFTVAAMEFRKQKGGKRAIQTMKLSKDPTIPVVILEDTAALIGLGIALAGLGLSDLTHWAGWDGVASLLIGVILAGVAYFLGQETHSLLVGESATSEDRAKVRELTLKTEGVVGVTQLLTLQRGPTEVLVAMKIAFTPKSLVEDVEKVINNIEKAVRAELPHMRYIFIEPDSTYAPHHDAKAVPQ